MFGHQHAHNTEQPESHHGHSHGDSHEESVQENLSFRQQTLFKLHSIFSGNFCFNII